MLEKLKALSAGAKAGIAGGVVLLAATGVGVGVWQPWNQPEESPDKPDAVQQEPAQPDKQPEQGLSLSVSGEKIPCVLYEGGGWSIYVPEDWTTEQLGNNGGQFSSGDGAQLTVRFDRDSGYTGSFVNFSADGGSRILQFYQGTDGDSPVIEAGAPQNKWDQYGKLFAAMARTLTVGDEQPFADSYIIPQEPDWQEAEGMTVLFLDKDGYVVDSKAQEAIEDFMKGWPEEDREVYTGQYRINSLTWASTYAGVTKNGYIDVFKADVQYRVKEGASPQGAAVVNGWATLDSDVYLAIFHDGGTVSRTQGVVTGLEDGWPGFLAQLT